MITHEIIGYWASTMVLLTFVTKDMRLLRILAIFSNIAFFSYGCLCWLPPVICLHLILLPINTIRLCEALQRGGFQPADLRPGRRRPIPALPGKHAGGRLFG